MGHCRYWGAGEADESKDTAMNEETVKVEQFRDGVLYDTFTMSSYYDPEFVRRSDGFNSLFQAIAYGRLIQYRIRWTPYAVLKFGKRFAYGDKEAQYWRGIVPIYPNGQVGREFDLLFKKFEVGALAPDLRDEEGRLYAEPNEERGWGWKYRKEAPIKGQAWAVATDYLWSDDGYLIYCPYDPRRWVCVPSEDVKPFIPPPPITIIDWTKVGTYA